MATSLDRRVIGENRRWSRSRCALPDRRVGQARHRRGPGPRAGPVPARAGRDRRRSVCYVAVLFTGSDPRALHRAARRGADRSRSSSSKPSSWSACGRAPHRKRLIRKQRPVIAFRRARSPPTRCSRAGIEGALPPAPRDQAAARPTSEAAAEAVKTILGPNTAARAGAYRATFKQNADSTPVRWELVAAALPEGDRGLRATSATRSPSCARSTTASKPCSPTSRRATARSASRRKRRPPMPHDQPPGPSIALVLDTGSRVVKPMVTRPRFCIMEARSRTSRTSRGRITLQLRIARHHVVPDDLERRPGRHRSPATRAVHPTRRGHPHHGRGLRLCGAGWPPTG